MRARHLTAIGLLLAAGGAAALWTLPVWIPVLVFRPTPLTRTDPAAWALPRTTFLRIGTRGGEAITAWWSPPVHRSDPVVLLVHGRSANIASRASILRALTAQGMGVLLFDYRGYGASAGRASEMHLRDDTLSAYAALRRWGFAPSRIVVVGQSLGNAPAAALAATQPVGGLVLVAPFSNLPNALAARVRWLPVRWIPWTRNRFDVAAHLSRSTGGVVLVASRNDGLIPIADARRLCTAAVNIRWIDVSPLAHDGMLGIIARDGTLTRAIHMALASAPGGRGGWSGRQDSNLRHPAPKAGALPDCATPRQARRR